MTDDSRFRDDEAALLLALFRYGVIAPLAERQTFARGEVTALVDAIAGQTHYCPGRGPRTLSPRTVYAWWRSFRDGGIEALRPKWRKDRGQSRALSPELVERAITLRQENPKRYTSTLLDILRLERRFRERPAPHRSTLDRHLARHGASRRQMQVLAQAPTIRMQFDNFGDLWLYPVADRYYLAEDLATLRDTLLRALLRWGPAEKVYVDRGSVYRSDQLAYSLQRLNIQLVHSRPYYNQGRGAIEKWWQVVGAFENEVALRQQLVTLAELNRLWEAYRELRYCARPHRTLGRSPNEAIAAVQPQPIEPRLARELFLVRVDRKVNKKEATVAVEGRRFLCDAALRGQRVQVRFDPSDFSSVLIFQDGQRRQRAFPQTPNAPPARPRKIQPPEPSVDYLALLRQDYDQKLLEKARPLAYVELQLEPGFDREQFLEVVQDLAGLERQSAWQREIRTFWETFGPLPESLVRIGCEHAVRLHGRRRHPRVYLHAIRTLVLAHWTTPEDS